MSDDVLEDDVMEKGEMSFLQHLEVLRWHLVRSASAIVICGLVAFFAKSFVFDTVLLGPMRSDFVTYRLLCEASQRSGLSDLLCIGKMNFILINTTMSGQFTTHMFVALISGLVLAFPYLIFEIWRFIKPGLYKTERKYANGMVFYTSVLFMMGVLFGYYVIAPMSINFLGNYQVSELIVNQIDLNSYFTTLATLVLATGLVFEMPILIYFLTKIGLVTPEFMRTYRRHSIVVILIIAAVITPPDVASQILVSLPLLVLYEISIYVSAAVLRSSRLKA